ncbi:uncharacterized protein LOC127161159 [Labeo rohita]|uniref:uncharacterized protein LOC127161159 n=1 Tax=Labeo rohita TaxID=84645 RepID=UPI0021E29F76|nr:uncharacterized protein LOC127161159 [Labeo rohita]
MIVSASDHFLEIFNDPIHGHIELHPLLVKMIDTPQFQRLRFIKQLGTKYLVYPGATHTRFEHSLGVAYLAGCLLKTLHENQPELNITKQDFLCVQVAALCHDMGHGPFSHLFDGMFIPEVQPDKHWEHEKASVDMFRCMKRRNGLDKEMKLYGLNLPEDIIFIEELILKGQKDVLKVKIFSVLQWAMKGRTEDKSFLYEIVANKVNGIDVDKWDYLVRDCYYLGIPCGFDHQRLLKSARVCNVKGRKHICFRDKVADNIYGMFHTRYTLHRQALQHKIGYIIDVKIKDALVKADDGLIPDRKISDAMDDMLAYTKLTDHVFDQILNQSDLNADLDESRGILQDIVNRRLPKFVGEARLKEDVLKEMLTEHWEGMVNKRNLDPEVFRFCEKMLNCLKVHPEEAFKNAVYQKRLLLSLGDQPDEAFEMEEIQKASLKAQPIKAFKIQVYKVLEMGFGEVGKEPINNVYFYSKNDLNTAFKMEKYQVSSLKPEKFHEFLVRVYYDPENQEYQREVQQKAEECFHEWCKINKYTFIDFGPDSGEEDDTDEEGEENEETSLRKIFNDPIYGQFELHPLLVKIIDTPLFQRLRHIKQLGGAYLVYPGATHTRFEHSLGMAHLAGSLLKVLREKQDKYIKMIEKDIKKLGKKQEELKKKQEELKEKEEELITEKDMLCVQIAALCYNLGHGPFSHLFERFIHRAWPAGAGGSGDDQQSGPSSVENWKVASFWIFLEIVRNKQLTTELTKEDLTFIQKLIVGDNTAAPESKSFLYEIVANNWNGIDVRKWDYFARDCHYLGIPNSFDHQCMLKSARVCKVKGTNHICFRDKVANDIYDMFHTRYTLYHQAYKHKIVTIIEDKIIKALLEAKDTLEISPISRSLSSNDISKKIENITSSSRKRKIPSSEDENTAKFIKLTDHIFEKILYSTDDELKGARKELEDVVMRRLPKCVGETRLNETEEKDKKAFQIKWNEALDEWNKLHPNLFLYKEDFSTEVIQLDYNKEAENPINRVYFYRKRKHTKGCKIKKYEESSLQPKKFSEHVGRVYYTKNSDEEEKDAKECFRWWRLGMCAIELYDQPEFKGTKCVITGDRLSLDCCSITEVRSCKVLSGVWDLYEGSDYAEPSYQLSEGLYPDPGSWCASDPTAPGLSVKRVTE